MSLFRQLVEKSEGGFGKKEFVDRCKTLILNR